MFLYEMSSSQENGIQQPQT